jgi:hypothetical protein
MSPTVHRAGFLETSARVIIYPNPAKGAFDIMVGEEFSDGSFKIFNVS